MCNCFDEMRLNFFKYISSLIITIDDFFIGDEIVKDIGLKKNLNFKQI